MSDLRVASLIPSATEIVCALGRREALVARSHECDHPDGVEALPALTEPKIDLDGSSREIDARVRSLLEDALSVYRVDADRLQSLRPDVILTQTQCDICAVHLRDVETAVCSWMEQEPDVVALEPECLADVWTDIKRVGDALGQAAAGRALVRSLTDRMRVLDQNTPSADDPDAPAVACIEWVNPLMLARGWMPELVRRAGGVPVSAGGTPPPTGEAAWELLKRRDPDVIVVMACGFGIERTARELPALTDHPAWGDLQAVRRERVFVADGNHYFNRPGPRLADALEILAEILHPALRSASHRGSGWAPLTSVRAGDPAHPNPS